LPLDKIKTIQKRDKEMNVDLNEPATKMFKNDLMSLDQIEVNEMTSKDYYFDSYAHFGIHEGIELFFRV
jgi:hypothetical protein